MGICHIGHPNVAGLCGLSAATISGCVNVANITGLTNVGGIAGSSTSPLSDCSNAGYINGTTAASTAGIVGSTHFGGYGFILFECGCHFRCGHCQW